MALRWIAAAIAFAMVAYLGIGVFGDFSEAAASGSWALWAAIALAAGFIAYALVEYLQTGALASITRQFDTRTIVLIPLAIAINIILGATVANALKIPIYLDSIGTILVGVLAGPVAGALTGFLANILWQYVIPPPFQGTVAAPFAIVAAVIGLMAGLFGRYGFLRPRLNRPLGELAIGAVVAIGIIGVMAFLAYQGWILVIGDVDLSVSGESGVLFQILGWLVLGMVAVTIIGLVVVLFVRRDLTAAYVVVAGLLTGIVAALISAPISANLFGGVTGAGTDFLVAAFRQAGADIGAATLGQGLISDPVDKITTFFVVYLVLIAMPRRAKARFPQGEMLVETDEMDELDEAEMPGATA
jgi:hypothetical protein